jgi:hypothetical protein
MPLTNRWNRFIYGLWAPFYDRAFARLFAVGRRQAMAALAPQPDERLLLAGIGTGADLPLLPAGVRNWPHPIARRPRRNSCTPLLRCHA